MKKTNDANIGGTIFHVEEDAYRQLEAYLATITAHFASYNDSADIVADIEGRIAEQLTREGTVTGGVSSRIVMSADVEQIIAALGRVEQFGDAAADTPAADPVDGADPGHRRLFRDPDDKVVAGVAAGLAAYSGISAIAIRLLLLALPLFWRTRPLGLVLILAYLLLWVVVPLAKTTTEKLQMRGKPVTLASVEQKVRAVVPGTRNAVDSTISAIGSLVGVLITSAAWVAGVLLTAGAVLGALACTSFLIVLLVNGGLIQHIRGLEGFFSRLGGWYPLFVAGGYLVVTIPLVLIAAILFAVLRHRNQVPTRWGLAMAGCWLLSLFMCVGFWAMYVRFG